MLNHQVIEWSAMDADLVEGWESLLERRPGDMSLSPWWIEAIAKASGKLGGLKLAVARTDDGRVTAVLPYAESLDKVSGVPMRTIHLAGNFVSYHQDAIGESWPELFHWCRDRLWRRFDLIVGVNILDGGDVQSAFRSAGSSRGCSLIEYPGEVSPMHEIAGAWEDYLQTRKRKFRNMLGRIERRFSEQGEYVCKWYGRPEDTDELLSSMLAIEKASWKSDANMAVEAGGREHEYYQYLLPALADRNRIIANVEYLDGTPVAYSLCYREGKAFRQLKTSFTEEYKDFSVGLIAIKHSIISAYEQGMEEFDFLGDRMPHKMKWATAERSHTSYYLYNRTVRGFTLGSLKRLLGSRDR